jgi:hypothetical protein
MNAPLHVRSLRIHRLAIPMRVAFNSSQSSAGTIVAKIPRKRTATSLTGMKLNPFFL